MSSVVKCTSCGSDMIRRQNKAKGNYFYGCGSYPKCKETMSLRKYDFEGALTVGEHPYDDYNDAMEKNL